MGPIVSESVVDFFRHENVRRLIGRLKKSGLNMKEPRRAPSGDAPLVGKTFVFTGELESMPRGEAEGRVKERGGVAVGSVSVKTSYVVAGKSPGSKAVKAAKLGVEILNEAAFLKLIS